MVYSSCYVYNITFIMTPAIPVLSSFNVSPRVYGSTPFDLVNPNSSNLSGATFTFASSNTDVATITGRTVTILRAGQTVITATQAATLPDFTSASITANFTVNLATPTITNFAISPKLFSDISFTLTPPTSNSSGAFTYRSLTPDIVTVKGTLVYIKKLGLARIEVYQNSVLNYYAQGSSIAEFDILSSIVRVGVQNQIDLSWNRPTENGATVKNYFFYKEERVTAVTPAPPVSTIIGGSSGSSSGAAVTPTNPSYYSYALPRPYYTELLSSSGTPTGIDINGAISEFLISTSSTYTQENHFDLGYYGEIEISWVYHNDASFAELATNSVASTSMTLNIYKESASATNGPTRIDLLLKELRTYNSDINCLGPRPQNNNKILTDIFTISFADNVIRELKYLKSTDVVSGTVKISSNKYSSLTEGTKTYSIILKTIRIAPYRLPITRDFTSAGFGAGNADTGVGFAVSTVNASAPSASSGILYHMPKMTRSLTDFNEARWQFSWNYGANLTRLATDISYLPIDVSGGNANDILAADLIIPFRIRLRAYSRPYSRVFSNIDVDQYNTTYVDTFLTNIANSNFHTRLLLDVSFNDTATYAQIAGGTATSVSRTFDMSGVSGFPAFAANLDTSHTQFVFLFQLTITDSSYNAYFQRIATTAPSAAFAAADAFRVKMLSQTFTPRQEYQFIGPDPTLASSNALTSATNTVYEISDPYTNVRPFYRFYNLTNGVFYSYRIASNNRAGTSAFSELFTRRCGSVPNTIVNSIVASKDTFSLESEKTSNQINLYWVKPSFSGYEINKFIIQLDIDVSGQWINFLDYTPDVSHNTLTFNRFEDTVVKIDNESITEYSKSINTYKNKNENTSYDLINGSKYYVRVASVNELGISAFSSVLSGVVFARPSSMPVTIVGSPVIGNQLIYLTWRIPQDDAGSPILNYIIDYEKETTRIVNGVTINQYESSQRYKISEDEPNRQSYPKDDFVEVYASYKKYDLLPSNEQTRIRNLRAELTRFVIPPTPITLRDSDYYAFRRDPSTGALLPPIANRSIILKYDQRFFSYIGDELTQNVFDISNIQLKWYYVIDNDYNSWNSDDLTVSFKMSIRGHLKYVTGNSALDISNIFYIPASTVYSVNRTMFSTTAYYKYINYITGSVIISNSSTSDVVPKIFIPTLPRIDSYNNNQRYKLQIDYQITEFIPSDGLNRFFVYFAPIIINGTAPVRTRSGLNTIFTLKIQNNSKSPILNNIKYRFKITPFNLNDYFQPKTVEERIGTANADPITDVSYSLISTSQGGIVSLQWKYSPISDYYITIRIPEQYKNDNEEYQLVTDTGDVTFSIFVKTLTPVNNVVTYTIPSTLPADIASGNAQSYLKAGRGYTISVAPVKIVEVANDLVSLPAGSQELAPSGTYIIPFRVPLRPIGLTALGNNGTVALSWKLPNLLDDPNYYTTIYTPLETERKLPFYTYRFYTLERRDISAATVAARDWVVVAEDISIPDGSATGSGAVRNYTVTGLTNENNHQFRVRLMIINDYNKQRALSDYTYLTNINAVGVAESSGNTVYPSIYPYKPSRPLLRYASRDNSKLKELIVSFQNPSYNGNADYYNVFIEYTPPNVPAGSDVSWNNIFDTTPGVGIATPPSVSLRTTNAVGNNQETFTVTCINQVIAYGIRIRLLGRKNGLAEPYLYTLYSDYSDIDFIDL
jgi:hypothetical protein